MTLRASQILETDQLPVHEGSIPVVRAYGDRDDPLRLTVLLAAQLAKTASELAVACKDPKASWRDRRSALRDLLRHARAQQKRRVTPYYAAFIDLDALLPTSTQDWEEAPAQAMRAQFFDIVRDAIAEGGWLVVRPWPTANVSEQIFVDDLAPASPSGAVTDFFMPDCRPTVRWLLRRGALTESDAMRIVTSVRDPSEHVLRVGYDILNADAREAARRLSASRAPSRPNGGLGDLAWGSRTLSRAAFDDLREAGFFQADDALMSSDYRLTRRARGMLSLHANAIDGPRGRTEMHKLLAKVPNFDKQPIDKQLEIHHHAAQAGDVDLAKDTALFYGTELSLVATRLSREQKAYKKAAELFRFILENFDARDAYALEYSAYNLARADGEAKTSGKHEKVIRCQYGEAHQLSPQNPLYHGRWLGYRAERGENVTSEIERGLAEYLDRAEERDDSIIVSLFADAALDGLRRGKQTLEHGTIVKRWRTRLELFAPRVLEKHAG